MTAQAVTPKLAPVLTIYRSLDPIFTMSREALINATRSILTRAGFQVSPTINLHRICFDMVGRKGDVLLIIKILGNVDAFSRENAEEMKILAEALGASPLLVGSKSSSGPLEPGIIYSRFNVPIASAETLSEHLLENTPPFIFAVPGGLYVRLDGDALREIREKSGVSLGTLAEIAGVSRRAIQMYESGMGAMIDAALRLEEHLGIPIIEPVDPFRYVPEKREFNYELSGEVRTGTASLDKLLEIGFSVTPVSRSPFEALSRDDKIIILTGLGESDERIIQKAEMASSISRLSGKRSVIIVEKQRSVEKVESTAMITKKELDDIDDKKDLTDLVFSRSEV